MRTEYVVQNSAAAVAQARLAWFREYQMLGNAKVTCERFGISRKTFYKWLKRYKSSGGDVNSLVDLPRTPHHSPRRTSDAIRSRVIEMRNATGFGPRRISRELRDTMGIRLSERTIWKIIRTISGYKSSVDALRASLVTETVESTPIAA